MRERLPADNAIKIARRVLPVDHLYQLTTKDIVRVAYSVAVSPIRVKDARSPEVDPTVFDKLGERAYYKAKAAFLPVEHQIETIEDQIHVLREGLSPRKQGEFDRYLRMFKTAHKKSVTALAGAMSRHNLFDESKFSILPTGHIVLKEDAQNVTSRDKAVDGFRLSEATSAKIIAKNPNLNPNRLYVNLSSKVVLRGIEPTPAKKAITRTGLPRVTALTLVKENPGLIPLVDSPIWEARGKEEPSWSEAASFFPASTDRTYTPRSVIEGKEDRVVFDGINSQGPDEIIFAETARCMKRTNQTIIFPGIGIAEVFRIRRLLAEVPGLKTLGYENHVFTVNVQGFSIQELKTIIEDIVGKVDYSFLKDQEKPDAVATEEDTIAVNLAEEPRVEARGRQLREVGEVFGLANILRRIQNFPGVASVIKLVKGSKVEPEVEDSTKPNRSLYPATA